MLDWPAFGNALWMVSDQLGIRPEWQLPVMSLETGGSFSPAIMNPYGCVGLNQFCPGTYEQYVHVPVADYQSWPASQQLAGPILAYWRDALKQGEIRSSTRLMLAQLGTALLRTAPNLTSVVFPATSAAYQGNSGFDTDHKGYVTVQDLANAMAKQAATAGVQAALMQAYALRPNEQPRNPVYGDDWSTSPSIQVPTIASGSVVLAATAAVALAAGVGYAASRRRRFA